MMVTFKTVTPFVRKVVPTLVFRNHIGKRVMLLSMLSRYFLCCLLVDSLWGRAVLWFRVPVLGTCCVGGTFPMYHTAG